MVYGVAKSRHNLATKTTTTTNVLWLLTGFSSSCKFMLAFLVYTYNCVVLWILHWTGCSISKCFLGGCTLTFPPIVYERSHTYQDQEWSVFDFSNSNRCVRHLIVILICIFTMTNDVEYLFLYLFDICVSSCEAACSNLFLLPLDCLLSYYWIFSILYVFRHKSFISYVLCKYLLSVCSFSFILLVVSFKEQMGLILIKFNLSVCSYVYTFVVIYKKPLPKPSCNIYVQFFFCISGFYIEFLWYILC